MSTGLADAPPKTSAKKRRATAEEIIAKLSPYNLPPEWMEHVSGLNLMQRMHGAMADLGPIQKDAKVQMGRDGFRYHSHEQISANVKSVMEKWRIMQTATVIDEQREETVTGKYDTKTYFSTVRAVVRFVNIDDPADAFESQSVGYGMDTQDKSIGKAVTYAIKFCLMKAFMIGDGQELDNEAFRFDTEDDDRPKNGRNGARSNGTTNGKSRQSQAQDAMNNAQAAVGHKPAENMTNGELFNAIYVEVEGMGRSRDSVKEYFRTHDGAKVPADVPKERLLSLLRGTKAKRSAYETCLRMIGAVKDTEAGEALLQETMEGRCVFEIETEELHMLAEKIQDLGAD